MGETLDRFIEQNLEAILREWEAFARTRLPPASTMSVLGLRDHAADMLQAIARDMRQAQTDSERAAKSRGLAKSATGPASAASLHGVLRHLSGFDMVHVVSEFRALRAAVLHLWGMHASPFDGADMEALTRFNEGVDQALAESIAGYTVKIDESRDTFLAILGHDLRGPLAALNNCLELLANPASLPAPHERVVHIAKRSIVSMDGMITDLLEYTRTRLGRGIEVVPAAASLDAVCREAVEEARAAHADRNFAYQSSGDLDAWFDAPRIRQVMSNLLSNAVRHGAPASTIGVSVQRSGEHVSIVVRNDGSPIAPDALQVIFNPLVQVARADAEPQERPSTSLGLGLFIAREIVTAHGGEIGATSTAEDGTVFTVSLPVTATDR